ncbi:helix-turn-helix transcriptional regulator [Micromonospora sp. WMMD1082]|uniref:helix-turn-helix transcriptional regulator n=1 Tax=Micromonospora sp. WMMD1082 TaxID=3016104 RepID=UPI002415C8B7|nr:helix-turn-helix transcriptional regulator [Micromonospora sp. WMMD1082]MDG4797187.1 helix-turn-helix transcriptional regulator [Micromonospora sp. WMMD1082]
MADARKDLGRHLAHWRTAAGLTQVDLAARILYSRSQIANVESGRDNTTRRFWQNADATLGAHGALLAVYDQAHALMRDFHAQTELARDQERQLPTTQPAPLTSTCTASPTQCEGCGPTVVGRWTRREIHALREALRMSVRAFAEHLGLTPAAITAWEHRTTPATPTLAAQSVLDQALTLADTDSKARFRLLLDNPHDPPHRQDDRPKAGRSTGTSMAHEDQTPPTP